MRVARRIILSGIIFIFLIYALGNAFLFFKGSTILARYLRSKCKRKVTVGRIYLYPPFYFKINNLNIEGLLGTKRVTIKPNLFLGKTGLEAKEIYLHNIIAAEDAQLALRNLSSEFKGSLSDVFRFTAKANIDSPNYPNLGSVRLDGWANFPLKDMQADLEILGIDGIYLSDYLSKSMDFQKANIDKSRFNFLASLISLKNNLVIQCNLELADIAFRQVPEGQPIPREQQLMLLLLDVYRSLGEGRVFLDFVFHTRMDHPDFNAKVVLGAFEEKLARGLKVEKFKAENIVVMPGKLIGATIKNAVNISRSAVTGTLAAGSDLKSTIIEAFIKVKKAE